MNRIEAHTSPSPDSFSPLNSDTGEQMENYSRRSTSSASGSEDSASEVGVSRKELKQRRILGRMLPAGMITKNLQAAVNPYRRSTTTPAEDFSSPISQLLPGQTKTRVARDASMRDRSAIAGDSESSDDRGSVIDISSSSERSISDVEELRTQMYPGVLDIPLVSDSEDEESDADLEMVHDVDIGAWLHRHPANRRRPDRGAFEAKEGDLIDRMLSRTRVTSGKKRANRTNQGTGIGSGRSHARRPNGVHVFIGSGARPRRRPRQRRLAEFFEASSGHTQEGRKSLGKSRKEHGMSPSLPNFF